MDNDEAQIERGVDEEGYLRRLAELECDEQANELTVTTAMGELEAAADERREHVQAKNDVRLALTNFFGRAHDFGVALGKLGKP